MIKNLQIGIGNPYNLSTRELENFGNGTWINLGENICKSINVNVLSLKYNL